MKRKFLIWTGIVTLTLLVGLTFSACTTEGPQGPPGPAGPAGPAGELTEEQTAALDAVGALSRIDMAAEPHRGCSSCHVGSHNLAAEAFSRAEAAGDQHPAVFDIEDDVNVTECLTCHASGTDGKGAMAELSLRDILHPSHMGSQYFKLHYGGNCFSCHNVNYAGDWEVLTEAVDVNEKGIPNEVPIPGAQ